jgi:hypothetical protein
MALPNGYKRFIEDNLQIVDKNRQLIPFKLNIIQDNFVTYDATNRSVILKARQQGFSSLILALFTVDFLLKDNSRSIIVADQSENAIELLERVKFYIQTYEEKRGIKIPMKYDSKYELYNEITKAKYTIGTAQKAEFGRSKTITNLHFSEAAFYPDMDRLLAGALQAVTPNGRVIIETTANGFNQFHDFWEKSERGETTFTPLFYKASDFYSPEFLAEKKKELGRTFKQEYPENPIEAFLSSGETFFNNEALSFYMSNKKQGQELIYPEYIS